MRIVSAPALRVACAAALGVLVTQLAACGSEREAVEKAAEPGRDTAAPNADVTPPRGKPVVVAAAISSTLASELRVSGAVPLYLPGDVDGSGALEDADEALLSAMLAPRGGAAQAAQADAPCAALADIDHDGAVTAHDVERLAETRRALSSTGHVVAWPRTKVGTCGALLPFALPLVARTGEVLVVRPLPSAPPSLVVKVSVPFAEVLGPAESRAAGAPPGGVAIRLRDDRAWSSARRQRSRDPESGRERDVVDIVVSVQVGPAFVDVPVAIELGGAPLAVAEATPLMNPEGQPKVPIVRGDELYSAGSISGTVADATGASCSHLGKRGASFVVNLLADWKYTSPSAQTTQDDAFDAMHAALSKPAIENDLVTYTGYDDARLYPRPKRIVWLTPTEGPDRTVQSQESDTLDIGDHAPVTIGTPPATTTADAIVTARSTTIAQLAAELAPWRAHQDAVKVSVDQLFAGFEQLLAQGRSWVFFYVGSHGSPPDSGAPHLERHGYWSTGLGWRIWWNRAEYLERARAKAAAGGACYFTAFDDSCYSGYTARFGIESAATCASRPATSLSYQGQKVYGDQWLGVSTDNRLAGLGECVAREQEIISAIGAAANHPKEWLWWLHPTNFGQAYVDRGRNADECMP